MGSLLLAYTFVPYQPPTSSRVHGFGTTVLTNSIAYICPSPPRFISLVSLSVVTDYDGATLVYVLSSLVPPSVLTSPVVGLWLVSVLLCVRRRLASSLPCSIETYHGVCVVASRLKINTRSDLNVRLE